MRPFIRHTLTSALALLLTAASLPAVRNVGVRASASSNVNRSASFNRSTSVNRNVNESANFNRNTNVNVNRDVNVNVNNGYHAGGCCYHPAATAAAVTATAVTAAIVGSRVNTLPPACSVAVVNGIAYQQCGGVWYQPQFYAGSTTYIVVNAP